MSSYATMLPLVQAGKLRILAVTSRKRVAIATDTPTVAEAGYPYLGLDGLIGMYGPRGMSMALRESIAGDVRAVVEADPTIASRLAQTGQVVDLRGPREFAAGIKESATSSPRSRKASGSRPHSDSAGASRRLNIRSADDLAPLFGFVSNELAEIRGRAGQWGSSHAR